MIEHGNEKEQGLREAIALGDGGHVRSVRTEAEGARVLEEGVVLQAVQAIVQGVVLKERIRGSNWPAAIERVQGRRAGASGVVDVVSPRPLGGHAANRRGSRACSATGSAG